MTTLEDRLAALADDAPPAQAAPGLWERGLRLHRRRRRGTVVIAAAAVVALAALGVASWRMADVDPAPAMPGDGLRLPDSFFAPSKWLPGTDDDGPIGPLVAVVGAERAGSSNGLVGVSATGEYRFLDLPSRAEDDPFGTNDAAISADGSRVGYWYEGAGSTVEGVAVYDTVTGSVDRLAIDSDHGLQMEALVWSGDRLWFEVYRTDDASGESATGDGTRVWDLATGEVVVLDRAPSLSGAAPVGDGLVVGSWKRLSLIEPTPGPVRRLSLVRPVKAGPVFASDGDLFAALLDDDGVASSDTTPSPILVGRLGDDGRVRLTEVPAVQTNELLGWRDSTHVVAFSYEDPAYYSIDIRTGESERLSEPAPNNWSPGTRIALDAWAGSVFDAPEPPTPMDPRLRLALGVGVVAMAGLGMWAWRRRVRP